MEPFKREVGVGDLVVYVGPNERLHGRSYKVVSCGLSLWTCLDGEGAELMAPTHKLMKIGRA